MYDFTLMLSRLYEDLDTSEDKLPLAPSFYRHVFPSPFRKGAPTENMLPRMPHLSNDLPMSEVMGRYASNDAASDHVQFRISGASTQKMLEVAKAGEDVHLSTQDAMSAYFVTLLNRIHSDKVSTVINAVNVSRHSMPRRVLDDLMRDTSSVRTPRRSKPQLLGPNHRPSGTRS